MVQETTRFHSKFIEFRKKSTVLKPTLVDLLKKLRLRENHVEGTRQITSVTSEKGGHRIDFLFNLCGTKEGVATVY